MNAIVFKIWSTRSQRSFSGSASSASANSRSIIVPKRQHFRVHKTGPIGPVLLAVALLSSCSTASHHNVAFKPKPQQSVIFKRDVESFPLRYQPAVVEIFERHSFQVVTNGTDALVCTTHFDRGAVTARASVSLYAGSEIVVTGDAHNPGFGTWLNPSGAKDDIIEMAIAAFDRELDRAVNGIPTPKTGGNGIRH